MKICEKCGVESVNSKYGAFCSLTCLSNRDSPPELPPPPPSPNPEAQQMQEIGQAIAEIGKALEGLSDEKARRVIHATAILRGIDFRSY